MPEEGRADHLRSPQTESFRTAQQLTQSSSEAAAEIYYTTDGTDVFLSGGTLSAVATLYTAPVDITGTATVNFAAIDPSENVSERVGTVTPNWAPVNTGSPDIGVTRSSVQAYTADGVAAGPRAPWPATGPRRSSTV